jgi:hypothetical protein
VVIATRGRRGLGERDHGRARGTRRGRASVLTLAPMRAEVERARRTGCGAANALRVNAAIRRWTAALKTVLISAATRRASAARWSALRARPASRARAGWPPGRRGRAGRAQRIGGLFSARACPASSRLAAADPRARERVPPRRPGRFGLQPAAGRRSTGRHSVSTT